MRFGLKSLSQKVWLAIVAAQFLMVFAVHDFRDETRHLLSWDAYGYYLYLPGAFIFHDLTAFQFVENQHVAHFISGTPYQIRKLGDGRRAPSYTMGLAVLWLPFFLVAHFLAGLLGFPTDGLTLPYQLAIAAASVVWCAVGFAFLRKTLRHFFSEMATGWTLASLFFSTNLFYFFTLHPGLTHGYLFAAFAVLLWLTVRWHEKPTLRIALALGATLGLMVLIRPAAGLAGLLPVFYSANEVSKWRLVLLYRNQILAALAVAGAVIFPQLLVWKMSSGHWFFNAYAAAGWGFDWRHPDWLHKIFGYEKGWLVYSPVLVLALVGYFFLKQKAAKWLPASLLFLGLNSYVVFCYNQWPFDSSFGFRGLVECYPVLALPMAAFFEKMRQNRLAFSLVGLVTVGCLGLNLFQTWQTERGILWVGPNSKSYFWQVFLKTERDPRDLRFLDLKERKPACKNCRRDTLASFRFSENDSISVEMAGIFAQKAGGDMEFSRAVELVLNEKTAAQLAGKWLSLAGHFYQKPAHDGPENCAVLVLEITRPGASAALKWVSVHLQRCIPGEKWADFKFETTAPPDLRADDRIRGYLWMPGCDDRIWVADLSLILVE